MNIANNTEAAADIKLLAEDADLSGYSPMPFLKAIIDLEHDSSNDKLNIDVKYDVDGKITMISFETSI